MKYFFTGFSVLCLSGAVQAQVVNNGGTMVFTNGVAVQMNTSLQNQAGSTLQNNGTINVTGNIDNNGTVKGNGTIGSPAAITNVTGLLSPGNDNVGQLNVTGNYNNGAGTLAIEIGGTTAGTGYDRLAVTGAVSAAGTLNVNLINAYTAPPSTTFDIVTATSVSGTFSTLNLPSGWTVIYQSDKIQVKSPAPLPVLFDYFTGNTQGQVNHLDWKVNCSGPGTFVLRLQRSGNGKDFTDVHQTETNEQRSGLPFAYEDRQPLPGSNYYRLSVTEADGKVSYSNIVTLNGNKEALEVVSLSPNPVAANGLAVLRLSAGQQGQLKITVTDAAGRRIIEQNQSLESGINTINLRGLQGLAPGIYQATLYTNNGNAHFIKFAKQ